MDTVRLVTGLGLVIAILTGATVLAREAPQEPRVDLIAYVTPEGAVEVIAPDGTGPSRISPDVEGFFTWPTWSPDARRIVFSGLTRQADGQRRTTLLAYSPADDGTREIYVDESPTAGLVAEDTLHYAYWSPNGERLAFIAITPLGLSLFVDDLSDDPGAEHVMDNGPLWICWSPDSSRLVVHRRNDHFIVEDGDPRAINVGAGNYRVPSWEPHTEAITVAIAVAGTRHSISTLDPAGTRPISTLTETSPAPAFLWSPGGRRLAVADSGRPVLINGSAFLVYTEVRVLGRDGTGPLNEVKGAIVAHFWSPNGAKLAYVTLAEHQGMLRWNVLDVESGERWPLTEFTPSTEQMVVFQFFDQYAHSHTPWSPNSDALVFAGNLDSGPVAASHTSGRHRPNIIVAGVDEGSPTLVVAEGRLASWSPR